MAFLNTLRKIAFIAVVQFIVIAAAAQPGVPFTKWTNDGSAYYQVEKGEIVKISLPSQKKDTAITKKQLTTKDGKTIVPRSFQLSTDGSKALFYTNAKKVWRYPTRGDYWLLNISTGELKQMGKGRPEASLQFAKFSPDGKYIAYVSEHNIYTEELSTGKIKKITSDNNTKKLINGTFDWVYEEEFFCRDGFRWGPDSKSIAYWQIDANKIRDYYMLNTTDSVYSKVVPVEYPKVGEKPSPARIGVVNIITAQTKWMNVPGAPDEHYIMRMEWAGPGEIILQQLNRKQNESKVIMCNAANGSTKTVFSESDKAWVATLNEWRQDVKGWDWIASGKEFIWFSEKDGWRHLYRIGRDGKETKITNGDYDVIDMLNIDEKTGYVYFYASPVNATQQYLYKTKLDGSGGPVRVSPAAQEGSHNYEISPNGIFARHSFSNYYTSPKNEWVTLPDHKPFKAEDDISKKIKPEDKAKSLTSFFQVTTEEGVTMDGWITKPKNFDSTKKYPVVFYVYGEPASTTVNDGWGAGTNFLYNGDMTADGYIQVSLDNRGTPSPKGREWRKAIYQKIGQLNIRDQALGAKQVLKKWNFLDTTRVAVWGWSGGGSSTLNLMFQYPDEYQTGISIAPVTSSLYYDNIYTERYMGLPQENMEDYKKGAALTHAKNLKGDLLFIHGTGDDNVHYQNAEALINELVKNGKSFQMMSYPNRTHNISEGEGTFQHLGALYTKFLKEHCPPGGRTEEEVKAASGAKKGF
ncbi:MAG: prolyl oligopeptidase family serine peptidase [Chitinophagaceae bacterium]|nr:prolyl oligopeptidase family serine peptidase [Chitinophagaceae bacterium]